MKIWQSWAGNHSADFTIVGQFDTPLKAEMAFRLLSVSRKDPMSAVYHIPETTDVVVSGQTSWQEDDWSDDKLWEYFGHSGMGPDAVYQLGSEHYELGRLLVMEELQGMGADKLYWGKYEEGEMGHLRSMMYGGKGFDTMRHDTYGHFERGPRITKKEIEDLTKGAESAIKWIQERHSRGLVETSLRNIKPKVRGPVHVRSYQRGGRRVKSYTRRRPRR